MNTILKKLFAFLLIGTLSLCLFPCSYINAASKSNFSWPSDPSVYAKSAVLIDASSGQILYSKKGNKQMYPASITKIMTALLTIENCDLDDMVTFSENAVYSLDYDDANFGCQVGEQLSVRDCLYILMLASANEVATALAEHISGSVSEFANLMNERAVQAGAKNTHFSNANGLHADDHYVTSYDMAMIMRDAVSYPLFNEIINTTSYHISKNNKRTKSANAIQRHKMVWPTSGYYYDGIVGGKTGYTDQAGNTLVTYAARGDVSLIAVVMGSDSTHVYLDTSTLLDYGFDNFKVANISEEDTRFLDETSSFPLLSPFCDTSQTISIDPDASFLMPKNANFSDLDSTVSFEKSGDYFASITYSYLGHTLGGAGLSYESAVISNDSSAKESDLSPNDTALDEDASSKDASTDDNTTLSDDDTDLLSAKETSSINEDNADISKDTGADGDSASSSKTVATIIIIVAAIIVIAAIIVAVVLTRRKMERIRSKKRARDR